MASKKARLVSFHFNVQQAYILEFGENYIRFYKDGVPIMGNGSPYEVTTTYAEADIFDLDVSVQSADTLYILHPSYPPKKLVRSGHANWSFTTITCGGVFVGAGNYPACGALHEQRFWYASTTSAPVTLWGSDITNYELLTNDPEDPSTGVSFNLVSGSVDKIRWLQSAEHLLAGSAGGIWKIWPTASGEAISQENINARKQISTGCSGVHPIAMEDAVLFVTQMKTTLRRIAYSFEADKLIAPSMMRVASHIAEGASVAASGITQLAFQKEPFPILWATRADGQLLGMVYDIQEKVYAWLRVKMDGLVESVACISKDGEEDQVWIIVKRDIAGLGVKRYVEYFKPHNFYSDIKKSFFVHSGLSLTGVNNTITLAHLEGETVVALVDGKKQGPFVVPAGGVVTLTTPSVTDVHAGLPYDSIVEPMKLHVPTEQGTARGKKQKINKATICLYETGQGVQVGPNTSNMTDLFLDEANPVSGALLTGDVDTEFEGDWGHDATIVLKQPDPLPMTVLGIIPRVTVHDED